MNYNPIYAPQTNSNGERVSTNAYYTGHQIGTVIQDGQFNTVTQPYAVEESTVHIGSIIQDGKGNMPGVGVKFVQNLTGCSADVNDAIVAKSTQLKVTYTAASGYTLPTTVTVKVGGTALTVTTDYTFAAGVLTIPAAKVTGDLEVTVTATAAS